MKPARIIAVGGWLLVGLLSVGCSSLPSLDRQKQLVQQGDYRIQQLTPRAFVEIWGADLYPSAVHAFLRDAGRTADSPVTHGAGRISARVGDRACRR